MRYHGKGPVSRMRQSASDKERQHNVKTVAWQWTPAGSDAEAYQHEAYRIGNDNGVANPSNFNINNSPGAKSIGPGPSFPDPATFPGAVGAAMGTGTTSPAQ